MYGKEVDAAECEDMFIPDYRLFLHEESAVLRVERVSGITHFLAR